jgi:hypothetical protein
MSSMDLYSPQSTQISNNCTNNSTNNNGCSTACEAHRLINSTHNSSSSALPLFHIHGIMSSRSRSLLHTLGHHHAPLILVLQLLAATAWPRDEEGLPTQHVSNGPQPLQRRGTALRGARCYCATVHRHGLLHCKHDHRECQLPLVCVRRHCGAAACTFTKRDRERESARETRRLLQAASKPKRSAVFFH